MSKYDGTSLYTNAPRYDGTSGASGGGDVEILCANEAYVKKLAVGECKCPDYVFPEVASRVIERVIP